jgi:hypothetical protein
MWKMMSGVENIASLESVSNSRSRMWYNEG